MKKYLLVLCLIFTLGAGTAVSDENKGVEEAQQSEASAEQSENKKDCKKVCVKRDGYGVCKEFEERCEE